MSLAILQYVEDNDESFPAAEILPANTYSGFWPVVISAYVKNYQIYTCPSRPSRTYDPETNNTTAIMGYAQNPCLNRNPSVVGAYVLTRMPQVAKPSETILVQESYTASGYRSLPNSEEADSGWPNPDFPTFVGNLNDGVVGSLPPHFDGSNYAFIDGHVKFVKANVAFATPDLWRINK